MTEQPTLPPAPAAAVGGRTSVLAIFSLAAGVLTWVSLPLFFLVVPTPLCTLAAIICGHLARAEIRRDRSVQGDGMAIAGLVLGWAMVLSIVLAVLAGLLILGGIAGLIAYLASLGVTN